MSAPKCEANGCELDAVCSVIWPGSPRGYRCMAHAAAMAGLADMMGFGPLEFNALGPPAAIGALAAALTDTDTDTDG